MKIREIIKNLIGKRQKLLIFCASAALLLIVAMVAISSATSLANGSESGRTEFFLADEEFLNAYFEGEILKNYGSANALVQNFVFKCADEVIAADEDSDLSYVSYFHDFSLRPYSQETLIAITAQFSGNTNTKIEIKYSGSEDGGLMFLSENYDVTPIDKKLQGTVINTDEYGTTTAFIDMDSELLNRLSYLTFSSCSEYILKLTSYDPNLTIYSISIYSYDGTFAVARGMTDYTEYTEPFAQISYTQGAGQIIGCRYTVSGNGVSICSNAAGSICIDDCADGYYVDIYGGLSEDAIQKELKNLKPAEEESTEETSSEETTDESTDESTEETSSGETTEESTEETSSEEITNGETTGESTEETLPEEISEVTQEEPAPEIVTEAEEATESEIASSEPEATGVEEIEDTATESEAA